MTFSNKLKVIRLFALSAQEYLTRFLSEVTQQLSGEVANSLCGAPKSNLLK